MQVSNTFLVVAAELCAVLLIVLLFLFLHSRKLKSLVRRQQDKIIELLRERREAPPVEKPVPAEPTFSPTQNFKAYLNQELEYTSDQFKLIAPNEDISAEQPTSSPLFQRILALRYAVLRTEELGTTEFGGSEEYWNIFQQALEPLLAPSVGGDNPELLEELETCKKRIENLEKFKRLFFDMEKQWSNAQANAQDYYAQLMAMSDEVVDSESFTTILDKYHGVYDPIRNTIVNNVQNPDGGVEHKTINITRHDPRAAEEIIKLRNVAADQHRVINQLQRRLVEANTAEEKESIIQELQQQLHRQTRFVQESETCVQLLEEELSKAQEELSQKDRILGDKQLLDDENQRMKETLHNFAMESGELMLNIDNLERENDALKQNSPSQATLTNTIPNENNKQLQIELTDLKKQYAELEERYLDLKLSSL